MVLAETTPGISSSVMSRSIAQVGQSRPDSFMVLDSGSEPGMTEYVVLRVFLKRENMLVGWSVYGL